MSDYNVNQLKPNNSENTLDSINSLTTNNLFKLYQKDMNNPYVDNLLYCLKNYYKQLESNLIDPYNNQDFKVTIFNALEELLYEVSTITSKELRDKNIQTVYDWFNNRYTYYQEMQSFDSRSTSDPGQILTSLELGVLPVIDSNNEGESNEKNKKHHSIFDNVLQNPKHLLKTFMVKKIDRFKGKIHQKSIRDKLGVGMSDDYENNNNEKNKGGLSKLYTFTPEQLGLSSTCNTTHITYSDMDLNQLSELKSSYSFYRPQYNYSHLYYEKLIAKAKNVQIAQRSTQKEIIEIMHEYGFKKSKMNKANTYKQSLRELVDYYKKQLLPPTTTTIDNKKHMENKKEKEEKAQAELRIKATTNNTFNRQKSLAKTNFSPQHLPKYHKSSNELIFQKDSLSSSSSIPKSLGKQSILSFGGLTPRESNKTSLPTVRNFTNYKGRMSSKNIDSLIHSNFINKVITNKVMNLLSNKILQPDLQHSEKTYTITLHINPISSFNTNYYTNKIINEDIPIDFICQGMNKDPITNKRLAYEKLIDVKRIHNIKTGYEMHYAPISRYDLLNETSINKSSSSACIIPRNGYEYGKINWKKNDYLTLRMSMNNYKPREVDLLCSTMRINGMQLNKNKLKDAFVIQKNMHVLPNCHLPHSGSGLLKIPEGLYIAKGKKK